MLNLNARPLLLVSPRVQSDEPAAVNAVEPKSHFADLNARRDAELGPKFPMGLTSANLRSVLVHTYPIFCQILSLLCS